jgi:hypothetical protein
MARMDNQNDEAADAFSPEEQQLFDAMQSGQDVDTDNLPQLPDNEGDQQHPGDDNGDWQQPEPQILPPGSQQPQLGRQQSDQQQPAANDDGSPADDPDIEQVVDQQTGKKRGRVSFAKFQKVQQEYEQTQTRLRELETKAATENARLAERLAIINEALTTPGQQQPGQQQEQEDPEPDPTQDIFAYSQWQGRQLNKLKETVGDLRTGITRESEERTFRDNYTADVNRYVRKQTDFPVAVQHLAQARDAQLRIARPDLDEAGRMAVMAAEERRLVQDCLKQNKSPSAMLYELSKAYGYKPAPPAEGGQQPGQQQQRNGQQQPQRQPQGDPNALDAMARNVRPNGQPQPQQRQQAPQAAQRQPHLGQDPRATIEAINNGQQANMSLSQMGGGAPQLLTPEAVSNMSEEEFALLVDRLSENNQRALFGD